MITTMKATIVTAGRGHAWLCRWRVLGLCATLIALVFFLTSLYSLRSYGQATDRLLSVLQTWGQQGGESDRRLDTLRPKQQHDAHDDTSRTIERVVSYYRSSDNSPKVKGGKSGGEAYSDSEQLREAYRRSPCSRLKGTLVGSDPLFPPCLPSIPRGVATWGKYPYIGPFNYTERSKNPCFYTAAGKLRCVPYFFLAGFSKCGTSDLFSRLSEHPQIKPGIKEHKWFSRRRFPEYVHSNSTDFNGYLDGFSGLAKLVERDIRLGGHSKMITGDASVMVINEVFEWPQLSGNEGCSEPRVINANHVRHLNPDVKVIIIMRHPVQRLYSRFLFDYKRSSLRDYREHTEISQGLRNPQHFHDSVVDGLQKYQACFDRFSLRHCVYNRTLWESVHGLKIQDSMYSVLIEDWLRVIPRDQILFLRSEDSRVKLRETLETAFKFLDLDRTSKMRMDAIVQADFRTVNTHPAGPMLPQTEQMLKQFFQPFIHRVAQLLNDPRFLWEDL